MQMSPYTYEMAQGMQASQMGQRMPPMSGEQRQQGGYFVVPQGMHPQFMQVRPCAIPLPPASALLSLARTTSVTG